MQKRRVWFEIKDQNRLPTLFLLLAMFASTPFATRVHAQIDRSGSHSNYSIELEPHGLIQWDVEPWDHVGFGLGLRASIPVIKNGPVSTINNSLAIGFGFDWAHASHCRVRPGPYWEPPGPPRPAGYWESYDCNADNFEVPVVVQWNFFFSDVMSLMVELGLDVRYETWSDINWYDDYDIEAFPQIFIGPRFTVGKNVAIPIRIGWPYLSVGVSLLI